MNPSPTDVLYAFMGWLTTRDEVVKLSSRHNAAVAADLVDRFCKANGFPESVSDDIDKLVHPPLTKEENEKGPRWNANRLVQPIATSTGAGPGARDEVEMSHPSFGQVTVSRVSGGMVLYGSDFVHNQFIEVEVTRSVWRRGLSNNWYYAREVVLSFRLSEAQWATFVSSMNMGSGTPCTLSYSEVTGRVPEIERLPDMRQVFKADFIGSLDESRARIETLRGLINDTPGLSQKRKDNLISQTDFALRGMTESLVFVNDQIGEHVENTIERAKVEIHGIVSNALRHAGIKAIEDSGAIISLPGASE